MNQCPLGLLCWHRVYQIWMTTTVNTTRTVPDSKVHGAYMGPTWGRQDPGGPLVGPMSLAIRGVYLMKAQPRKKILMGVGDDDIMWIPKELLIHPNKTKKLCVWYMASTTYTILILSTAQSQAIDSFASIENNTCSPWGLGLSKMNDSSAGNRQPRPLLSPHEISGIYGGHRQQTHHSPRLNKMRPKMEAAVL